MAPVLAKARRLLHVLGPGLVLAATGVGAGDLATASFTGSHVGTAVLWAVVAGAVMKLSLNEGLARFQLASGATLLEGVVTQLGRGFGWAFLPYLVLWSFFVGSAMMSACGVTLHALVPLFDDAERGKLAFGLASSAAGVLLVWRGGFALIEKVMSACIALMVAVVVVTAIVLWPGTDEVLRGLLIPSIPEAGGAGVPWTVALMGGIGGTLTILCYGYWIREEGRLDASFIGLCRLDLASAYLVTGVFGVAMVIVGSRLELEGGGAGLLLTLAGQLDAALGPAGRWAFLVGAAGAVTSSLLGVWQAVPYLFSDLLRLLWRSGDGVAAVDVRSAPYRAYLLALATVPAAGLFTSFERVQQAYAVVGASFMPLLSIALLVLGTRRSLVGVHRHGPIAWIALSGTLAFFGWLAVRSWTG